MNYRVNLKLIEPYQVEVEASSVKEAEHRARAQAAAETGRRNCDWEIAIESVGMMEEDHEPRYLNRVKTKEQRFKEWLILCDECLQTIQELEPTAQSYGMVIGDYRCEHCGRRE